MIKHALFLFPLEMEHSGGFYSSVYEPNGHAAWADNQQHQDKETADNLRRKIKYFFMNPCEKYKARGRKPWKLMLQIIKIAIITIQVLTNEQTVNRDGVLFGCLVLNYSISNPKKTQHRKKEIETDRHSHILITQISSVIVLNHPNYTRCMPYPSTH